MTFIPEIEKDQVVLEFTGSTLAKDSEIILVRATHDTDDTENGKHARIKHGTNNTYVSIIFCSLYAPR